MNYLAAKSRVQWRAFMNTVMNSIKWGGGVYPD